MTEDVDPPARGGAGRRDPAAAESGPARERRKQAAERLAGQVQAIRQRADAKVAADEQAAADRRADAAVAQATVDAKGARAKRPQPLRGDSRGTDEQAGADSTGEARAPAARRGAQRSTRPVEAPPADPGTTTPAPRRSPASRASVAGLVTQKVQPQEKMPGPPAQPAEQRRTATQREARDGLSTERLAPQTPERTEPLSQAAVRRNARAAGQGTDRLATERLAKEKFATERLSPENPPSDALALTGREVERALRRAARDRRRVERQEVRRFTRTARRRRAGLLVGAGALAAVGIVIGTATFSPVFALRTVQVEGTSRLAAGDLAAAFDDQLGRPIPLLDQRAIDRHLAAFPIVRSYVLESRLPHTLVVRVVERTPVGTVQTPSGFELVDSSGVTVQTTATRASGFPLILLPSGAAVGDRGAVGFTAAASVLAALPAELLARVDSITARSVDDVTLQLTAGQRVIWGSAADSVTKAKHLTALLAQHPTVVTEYDVSSPSLGIIR